MNNERLMEIKAEDLVQTEAVAALKEIKEIVCSELSDFKAIEEIISVFQRYNIDFGDRHDF